MGCRLSDFKVGEWKTIDVQGNKVQIAPAKTLGGKPVLTGVVYKVDGVFQGFTGNEDAVLYHVNNKLKGGA